MSPPPFTETHLRSAVKAMGWRACAGVVTVITAIYFTGSWLIAAKMAAWEVVSKSATMFIGERMWNTVAWGKRERADAARRSLLKALAWRAFAALNTLCTALFFTRKASASGGIMLTETVVKTSMFYAYERVWARVPWGKVFSSKPALGGKQLSAKFFQDQAFPTAPPTKLRHGSPYPVDRNEHDD